MDEHNQPQVNISLDSAGGNIMSNSLGQHRQADGDRS